jgi:hypothetical protein
MSWPHIGQPVQATGEPNSLVSGWGKPPMHSLLAVGGKKKASLAGRKCL